jgi:hypothetical protein
MRNTKQRFKRACAQTVLALLFLAQLEACFSAHGGPKDSTETGNPPAIDTKLVTLKVSADMVHIAGAKGAVTPGGSAIEITNLATGEVTKATAGADGSFDVRVDGSLDDTFVVRASSGDKSSAPVYVVRGGAMVGGGSDGSLTCAQREQLAGEQLQRAAASADAQCMVDGDCQVVEEVASCYDRCQYAFVSQAGQHTIEAASAAIDAGLCSTGTESCPAIHPPCTPPPPTACVAGRCRAADGMGTTMNPPPNPLSCSERDQLAGKQIADAVSMADRSCMTAADCVANPTQTMCHDACGGSVYSKAGSAAIDAAVARIDKEVCGNFTAEGCSFTALPCMPATGVPVCTNGQCAFGARDSNGPAACPGCLGETIEWGPSGGLVRYTDLSKLEPCVHYTHTRTERATMQSTPLACETDLMACNSTGSVGAVETAFSHADVQRALAGPSEVLYGSDPRPLDGQVFEIMVGSHVIDVGGACNGQAGCMAIPAGIQALVDELNAVDQAMLTTSQCKVFAAPDPGSCPPDRKLATVCTMCGLAGGCAATMQTCAKVCSNSMDCAGDTIGPFCSAQQVCEQGGCI